MCGSRSWSGTALGVQVGGNVVSCNTSCVSPVSGSCVGNVGFTKTEAGGDDDEEDLGICLNSRKNFLFLNVTRPVPSTFTAY